MHNKETKERGRETRSGGNRSPQVSGAPLGPFVTLPRTLFKQCPKHARDYDIQTIFNSATLPYYSTFTCLSFHLVGSHDARLSRQSSGFPATLSRTSLARHRLSLAFSAFTFQVVRSEALSLRKIFQTIYQRKWQFQSQTKMRRKNKYRKKRKRCEFRG